MKKRHFLSHRKVLPSRSKNRKAILGAAHISAAFLCIVTSVILILLSLGIHKLTQREEKHIKVGFIFVGDEITPYTGNFMKARDHLKEVYGEQVECVTKYNVPEDQIELPLRELVQEECDYIIASSYGYSTKMKEVAMEHPEIQFCVPTGDNANIKPILDNYHTCMGTIYQGRYVCGVVAGMKLKEMIDNGVINKEQAKIGYVAAFPYAEVISGYTSFFMGVRSVVPEATMLVKYTDTWSSYSLEKKVAMELIDQNCVIISQHSDTNGPAIACETAKEDVPVYHVGYNQSMTEIATTRSLVSCTVDYSYYFEQSVGAILEGKPIESCIDGKTYGQDAMAGFDKGWVRVLDTNKAIVAAGTEQAIEETIHKLNDGEIEVFYGPYTGTNPLDEKDTINLETPFKENEKSSSPTFCYVLDDVIKIVP